MGRDAGGQDQEVQEVTGELFADLPKRAFKRSRITSVTAPLWTENKARLIAEYVKLFTLVTKHGAYIDGFAAPQARDHTDMSAAIEACAAKLVLHGRPHFLRRFWLCDASRAGADALESVRTGSPFVLGRKIDVLRGDFNKLVDRILASGEITDRTAAFCLLDQRTFECRWETVEKLARHKQNGNKIELFYFLGTSWMDRAIGGTKNEAKIAAWWGGDDWTKLKTMNAAQRADAIAHRFADEFRYQHVRSWPITERGKDGGRTMYYMIHCSDHDRAPQLMDDAYRNIARPDPPPTIDIYEWMGMSAPVLIKPPRPEKLP